MSINGFGINGLVRSKTRVGNSVTSNYFVLAAMDTDNFFYVLYQDFSGRVGWGSGETVNTDNFGIQNRFGTLAPDLNAFTMKTFIYKDSGPTASLGQSDTPPELQYYGLQDEAGDFALGPAAQPALLSFVPTVNVETDRIFSGIWYKIFVKGTQNQLGGLCFPPLTGNKPWAGISNGKAVFKNLLFTFIPLNNFVAAFSRGACNFAYDLNKEAFNAWANVGSKSYNCSGINPNGCFFTLNNVAGQTISSCSDLLGYNYTTNGTCSGSTYAVCDENSSCVPTANATMVCGNRVILQDYAPPPAAGSAPNNQPPDSKATDPVQTVKKPTTYQLILIIGISFFALLILFFIARR